MSSEYGSGLIRIAFAAVPRRRRVLAAKVLVTVGLVLAVGEAIAFATYPVGPVDPGRRGPRRRSR
ncbi:hypothetical protein [Streptomyces sp. SID3343]|uniref:hypothetical protein n=1 Tax=Streptomyces sp. SID3343 TaxID=2690260 RepID=UPI00136E73B5|nr:hypothetical protein [Streptomyces sp. SID3343]MYW01727.1 hypothetical protein [Streptomyces sp. SID3343]